MLGVDLPGEATFILKTGKHPEGGTCKINPKHGVYAETVFNISCKGFKQEDDKTNLKYDFHVMRPKQKSIGKIRM